MPVLGVRVNATVQTLRRFSVLGFLRRRGERTTVQGLVERLEIRTPSLEQPVQFLSGGNQQKVAVARIVPPRADGHPRVRAHPGRRRRLAVRHLRRVAFPDRCRNRPAREVERPARAHRSVRPGAGDVPWADHRGDPRGRARRTPHRRGDRSRARPVEGRTLIPRCGHAKEPVLAGHDVSGRLDSTRLAVRKVIRDARDKNKWRKIVRFRLWMPVVLQLLLIVAVAWYTSSRFPGLHQPGERQRHPLPRRAAGGGGDGADARAPRRRTSTSRWERWSRSASWSPPS